MVYSSRALRQTRVRGQPLPSLRPARRWSARSRPALDLQGFQVLVQLEDLFTGADGVPLLLENLGNGPGNGHAESHVVVGLGNPSHCLLLAAACCGSVRTRRAERNDELCHQLPFVRTRLGPQNIARDGKFRKYRAETRGA